MALVSILVSFARVQARSLRVRLGRPPRSQTAPTYRERVPTDLERVLAGVRAGLRSRAPETLDAAPQADLGTYRASSKRSQRPCATTTGALVTVPFEGGWRGRSWHYGQQSHVGAPGTMPTWR
jgi:hypothetical protein